MQEEEKPVAKPIMIQGTASGVGKTILTMALCRIFNQDGYRVSPFKSQNITSNTARTKSGAEIALAQVLQALAAGAEPDANMNPVLLKPGPNGTQVILNWYSLGYIDVNNFPAVRKELMPAIMNAYTSLSEQYDIIVIEGAGSPVELNLTKNDIVNMGIAKQVNAPVLLVSDVDRGGVFASLYGTVNLFDESERGYVKATIVNRFKGDITLFREGIKIIENITNLPVAGVIPYIKFDIPDEDALYKNSGTAYVPGADFDDQFDLIADNVRKSLNMELIYKILNEGIEGKRA